MSPRRKTVPPTRVSSRSSQAGRSELIAREKNEKQSAKERTALDNRFHRTDPALSCAARSECQHTTPAAMKYEAPKRRATSGPRRLLREFWGGRRIRVGPPVAYTYICTYHSRSAVSVGPGKGTREQKKTPD